ncbi:MAG: TMEM165/GDT1 family protein [Clostridia bacterium]|nr:TMEM165/GDT1 family protein [Clostridia bacterium]
MQYLYSFFISFIFIFFSELGDKTQILVLSFSAKNKASKILLGVALGTLLSHGLAIAFGSKIGAMSDDSFLFYLKLLTYFTFLFFGIIGFVKLKFSSKNNSKDDDETSSQSFLIKFLNGFLKNCIFIIALTIAIGELGDKTFLASIGLGIQYPFFKIPLILGSICGMVASDSIAIFFGKWIGSKISSNLIELLSNSIFILFGIIGIVSLLITI